MKAVAATAVASLAAGAVLFAIACNARAVDDVTDSDASADDTSDSSQPTVVDTAKWCHDLGPAPAPWPYSPDKCTSGFGKSVGYWEGGTTFPCNQCRPRCDAGKVLSLAGAGEVYLEEDLPSDACTYEGELCDTGGSTSSVTCNGVKYGCDLTGFRCACTRGQWLCKVTVQGGAVCSGACP